MAAPSNRIGRYEIVEPLGHGGSGTLFLARDPYIDRLVAIKVFPFAETGLKSVVVREAHATARLLHPNIVTIFEVGEHDGHPFVVMEYIRGETLADIVRRREPLSLARKIQIIADVCAGLEYAHGNGVVHREVKPAKIMVDSRGQTKILEFGRFAAAETRITQNGVVPWTMNYLSPEQIRGAMVDQRSDLFAVGAVLYELLTYEKAFPGGIADGVLQRIMIDQPAPPGSLVPGLPGDLDRIIANGLQKDPSQRYADAGIMRRDLLRVGRSLAPSPAVDAPELLSPAPARSLEPPTRVDRESVARRRAAEVEQWLSEARHHLDQGSLEAAIELSERAFSIDPVNLRAAELMDHARAALEERESSKRAEAEKSRRRAEKEAMAARIGAEREAERKADAEARRAAEEVARARAMQERVDDLSPAPDFETTVSRPKRKSFRRPSRFREFLERARDMWSWRGRDTGAGGIDHAHASEESRRKAESAAEVAARSMPEVVPVFYATDRARVGRLGETVTYGSDRSLAGLAYGCTFVSIPPGHRRGHLERPSALKLQFSEDPGRHVVALSVTEYTKETFFDRMRKAMANPDERSTFVFIHGFNVDFNEALRRTAQLGFDLGMRNAPILYSWPSQGNALQYIADTNAATWTVPHLAGFLRELQAQSGATSIHLIAHSMGNQALTGALRMLRADALPLPGIFKQVVMTAPDLDAHVFERDLAPQIIGIGERTTLYASSRDEVLSVSKKLNAYRRAGDAADGIVVVEGVDSIDASEVSTGLGHSGYGDVRTVVEDLSLLLRLGLAPGQRNLVARGQPPKQHWAFPA